MNTYGRFVGAVSLHGQLSMKSTFTKSALCLVVMQSLFACNSDGEQESSVTQAQASAPAVSAAASSSVSPLSDPTNSAGWVLNQDISDEFNGTEIDRNKWLVQGDNGDYYIWKGRAPSQFVPHNVLVEDGFLRLRSQWEPDYQFANENYADGSVDAKYGEHEGKPMPVTTAAIVSHKRFLNGYMEVRSKAIDAAMTSAFWAIGYQSEIDVYEQMGKPKIQGNIREDYIKSTVHDWRPPAKRPTWAFQHSEKYPFRVADEFHVYAAEWGEDYFKLFTDGKEIYSVTKAELGDRWVLTNPMEIWLDSEIFHWLGMPHAEELPATFDVDYVRVWQKPQTNLLQRQFFGFEGPILFEQNPRPLKLVPENSENDDYQKFWHIDESSAKQASIVYDNFNKGKRSLKISAASTATSQLTKVVAPAGALSLPAGELTVSVSIWILPETQLSQLSILLADNNQSLDFDLSKVTKGKWVTLSQTIQRSNPSSASDTLSIQLDSKNITAGASTIYIDDIEIQQVK